MDDWNINGQKDLLGKASGTLDEIMDSLASGLNAFNKTNFLERDISQGMQVPGVVSLLAIYSQRSQRFRTTLRSRA